MLLELVLAEGLRAALDEERQQLEGLGREMDPFALFQELARAGIQLESAEAGAQANPPSKPQAILNVSSRLPSGAALILLAFTLTFAATVAAKKGLL
jgi:hypothetical protein